MQASFATLLVTVLRILSASSQQGSKFEPLSNEHKTWLERFNNGEDLGVDVFHGDAWINTKYICDAYKVTGAKNLRSKTNYNFYQHCWEPIYFGFY